MISESYQIYHGIKGIFALGGAGREYHDHHPPQCSQCEGVILMLSLPKSEVKHKPDNLVATRLEKTAVKISDGINCGLIPVPDGAVTGQHPFDEREDLCPCPKSTEIDATDLDIVLEHVLQQGQLERLECLCMSFIIVASHDLLLLVTEPAEDSQPGRSMGEAALIFHHIDIGHGSPNVHSSLGHDEVEELQSENPEEVQAVNGPVLAGHHLERLPYFLESHQIAVSHLFPMLQEDKFDTMLCSLTFQLLLRCFITCQLNLDVLEVFRILTVLAVDLEEEIQLCQLELLCQQDHVLWDSFLM